MKKYLNYKYLFVTVLAVGVYIYGRHEAEIDRKSLNYENLNQKDMLSYLKQESKICASQTDYAYGFLTVLILIGGLGYVNEKKE